MGVPLLESGIDGCRQQAASPRNFWICFIRLDDTCEFGKFGLSPSKSSRCLTENSTFELLRVQFQVVLQMSRRSDQCCCHGALSREKYVWGPLGHSEGAEPR